MKKILTIVMILVFAATFILEAETKKETAPANTTITSAAEVVPTAQAEQAKPKVKKVKKAKKAQKAAETATPVQAASPEAKQVK